MPTASAPSLNTAWQNLLKELLATGRVVSPRGQRTVELPQATIMFDMRYPVVLAPSRKLHVPFLGGEAYWILSGDDSVAGIAPFNRHITQFSDDGEKFFGAYGPKVVDQLPYVVAKLQEDPDTRQAGLTIWRESPPKTKDVPCTIALFFNLRDGLLNTHVFMRSSDAWLGLPYDGFNFTMITCQVLKRLNQNRAREDWLQLGTQYLTMVSSHLYEQHWEVAHQAKQEKVKVNDLLPAWYTDPNTDLLELLNDLRHSHKGSSSRWFNL